ncbi:carbohydrate kinase family protein [Nocardia colli]|uniref:Carbohydrate kinase family protein n=1 Tax=Nocardia colli TaxID=2545717 RepID=A0A5N0E1U7_9NOCA|nr:carbohydrate kinase family protein [Nocardia colli]KAA8882926.1 carbohydrate kinase family protein [Nocardia colli]
MGTDPVGRVDATASSDNRRDVLVVGAYYADLVFHGLSRPVQPGTEVFARGFELLPGGAFTPAMAMRRLGHDVVWSTDFGTDLFSAQVLAAARAEGLDDSGFRLHTVPVRSVTAALSSPVDRAMVSYQDPVAAYPLAMVLREHRARVVILPLLQQGDDVLAALEVAHRLGTQVFMDCQDVPCTLETPTVREILGRVDIFAPNADEAVRVTGAPSLDAAIDVLAGLVNTLVVKRGSGGAVAVRDGFRCEIDSVPVEVVDTTAAGDCFNAGFLHAHLAGRPLSGCLATAVACGAAATTALGSSAAPDLTELPQWLARVPRARSL